MIIHRSKLDSRNNCDEDSSCRNIEEEVLAQLSHATVLQRSKPSTATWYYGKYSSCQVRHPTSTTIKCIKTMYSCIDLSIDEAKTSFEINSTEFNIQIKWNVPFVEARRIEELLIRKFYFSTITFIISVAHWTQQLKKPVAQYKDVSMRGRNSSVSERQKMVLWITSV